MTANVFKQCSHLNGRSVACMRSICRDAFAWFLNVCEHFGQSTGCSSPCSFRCLVRSSWIVNDFGHSGHLNGRPCSCWCLVRLYLVANAFEQCAHSNGRSLHCLRCICRTTLLLYLYNVWQCGHLCMPLIYNGSLAGSIFESVDEAVAFGTMGSQILDVSLDSCDSKCLLEPLLDRKTLPHMSHEKCCDWLPEASCRPEKHKMRIIWI